jgi:hypothetical protein
MKYLLVTTAALLTMVSTGSAQYYSSQTCRDLVFLARGFDTPRSYGPRTRDMEVREAFEWLYGGGYPPAISTNELVSVLDRMINTLSQCNLSSPARVLLTERKLLLQKQEEKRQADALKLEEVKREQARQEEEARKRELASQEEARRREAEARKAELLRQEEARRRDEEARKVELARIEEAKKQQEGDLRQQKIALEKQQELRRQREEEAKRQQELARLEQLRQQEIIRTQQLEQQQQLDEACRASCRDQLVAMIKGLQSLTWDKERLERLRQEYQKLVGTFPSDVKEALKPLDDEFVTLFSEKTIEARTAEKERQKAEEESKRIKQVEGELQVLYGLQLIMQVCTEHSFQFTNPKLELERRIKSQESTIPAERAEAVWNEASSRFQLVEPVMKLRSDYELYTDCDQIRKQILGMVMLDPNQPAPSGTPLRKRDF